MQLNQSFEQISGENHFCVCKVQFVSAVALLVEVRWSPVYSDSRSDLSAVPVPSVNKQTLDRVFCQVLLNISHRFISGAWTHESLGGSAWCSSSFMCHMWPPAYNNSISHTMTPRPLTFQLSYPSWQFMWYLCYISLLQQVFDYNVYRQVGIHKDSVGKIFTSISLTVIGVKDDNFSLFVRLQGFRRVGFRGWGSGDSRKEWFAWDGPETGGL